MMSSRGFIFSLFVLLLLMTTKHQSQGGTAQSVDVNASALKEEDAPMYPLVEEGKYEMMMVMNETRRKLGSFQICALCTCCGGARGVCLPSPCCYAINCNIPNRPFGFCSFTPKTCNCFGCHL